MFPYIHVFASTGNALKKNTQLISPPIPKTGFCMKNDQITEAPTGHAKYNIIKKLMSPSVGLTPTVNIVGDSPTDGISQILTVSVSSTDTDSSFLIILYFAVVWWMTTIKAAKTTFLGGCAQQPKPMDLYVGSKLVHRVEQMSS